MENNAEREDAIVSGNGESIVKIKLWGVIGVVTVVLGWFFVTTVSLDRRVTTLEAQYVAIRDTLAEIKGDTRDIKKNVDEIKYHYPTSAGSR